MVELSSEIKERAVHKLQKYFSDELDYELEKFPAEFLLEFISKELGDYFYNQGLFDSHNLIREKFEIIKATKK